MALAGVGMLAAPQANAAIVQTVDAVTDSAACEVVGPIYLHLRGLLELDASAAGLRIDINPAAIAALVLARSAPQLLKALRKGRSLADWFREGRLKPADLEGLGEESTGLIDLLEMAPETVRKEVLAYLSEQGVADGARLVGEVEALASSPHRTNDVFISYSHADDAALPRMLRERLVGEGLRVFFDAQSVVPGDDWYAQLEQQASRSRVMVALITRHFRDSWWQKEEVLHKINLQRADPTRHRIVPVLIDDPGPAFGLLQLDALRYCRSDSADAIVRAIIDAVRATADTGD